MLDDNFDDFFTTSPNDYDDCEYSVDDSNGDFPTTNAGYNAFIVDYMSPNNDYVNGHVIINQCGSLLNRQEQTIVGYRYQKYFLQTIAYTIHGESIPLLYPEAMLFPSIFWKMVPHEGSILGAIPSALLSEKPPPYGFASIKDHARCRLTLPGTQTSTNHRYISVLYDIQANLTMTRQDSIIILNRGLVEASTDTGLRVRGSNETNITDCIDSNQMVKNLCASQKYHKMDFFLTFTCNQSTHFGVKAIKNWIDDCMWNKYFHGYQNLTSQENNEIKGALDQAASGLLLRNWMEVRKILIDYLYSSPSCPYAPLISFFSWDVRF